MAKPLLLIDVDGPLNPYAAKPTKRPEGYLTHYLKPKGFQYGKGLRVWLRASDGPSLMATGAELVWATMWEEDANKLIGPLLGLPELPFIRFGHSETIVGSPNPIYDRGLYFKSHRIAYKMLKNFPGRPFLWIDDETTQLDEDFLKEVCQTEVKVLHIDPKIGISEENWAEINKWVEENV